MSSQSPAEALRQQIIDVLVGSTDGVALDRQQLDRKRKQYDADSIMELVTAYAATVEREARKSELYKLMPSITVDGHFTVDGERLAARLAALQGPQEQDDTPASS